MGLSNTTADPIWLGTRVSDVTAFAVETVESMDWEHSLFPIFSFVLYCVYDINDNTGNKVTSSEYRLQKVTRMPRSIRYFPPNFVFCIVTIFGYTIIVSF